MAEDVPSQKIYYGSNNLDKCYFDHRAIYYDGEEVVELKDILLKGKHNYENICAAIAAVKIYGISNAAIREVLAEFKGVEHRLEFVAEYGGIKYYNDSKATNCVSTNIALQSFTEPTILLLGGTDRGHSFYDLQDSMGHVKAIVAYGETKNRIAEETGHDADYIGIASALRDSSTALDNQFKVTLNPELAYKHNEQAAPNANAAKVLVIGDSVTLGAKVALETTIPGTFVDAKESRGIETATGIIAGYKATGKLPEIIVISLATNERTITDSLLQNIVNVAGNDRKFILVTAYAGPQQPRDRQNAALKDFASKHDNVYIADWWTISHDNWSLMYADHIHLNPEGRMTYANLIYRLSSFTTLKPLAWMREPIALCSLLANART